MVSAGFDAHPFSQSISGEGLKFSTQFLILINTRMSRIRKNNFIPQIFSILVQVIRSHNFQVGIFLVNSVFSNFSHAYSLLDMHYANVLWSSARYRSLFSHATPTHSGSDNKDSLFRLVPQTPSSIKSAGPCNPI